MPGLPAVGGLVLKSHRTRRALWEVLAHTNLFNGNNLFPPPNSAGRDLIRIPRTGGTRTLDQPSMHCASSYLFELFPFPRSINECGSTVVHFAHYIRGIRKCTISTRTEDYQYNFECNLPTAAWLGTMPLDRASQHIFSCTPCFS